MRHHLTFAGATLAVALAWSSTARAETAFYVDPDWSGSATGAAATPWTHLSAAAWTTINATLAGDDVVVYFSARQAGSATDQTTTTAIDIDRTDGSTHRLTLDGMSQYNTDDAAPSWQPAGGTNKFQVTARYPMSTGQGQLRDYVTIRGFRVIAGDDGVGGQIINYWGGSHVIIEHNDLSHHPNAGHGAGLQFGYAHHQGGGGNGGCTDITIRFNTVHDTFGECIYVGGSEDTGQSAHTGIVVEGNTTHRCGVLGGEGDCIDIKDGNTDVTIRSNHCYGNADGPNVNGITSSSPITAERNVIHDTPGKGITFGTFWGQGYSNVTISHNILFNNAKDGIYAGTESLAKPIDGVTIVHNTVVGNAGDGLLVGSGEAGAISNVSVVNNIFVDNLGAGLGGWGDLGGCMASYNDLLNNSPDYAGPFSGCDGTGNNLSVEPQFGDPTDPPGADGEFFTNDDGFKPVEGSAVCGAGEQGEDLGALPCGDIPGPDAGTGGSGGTGADPDGGTAGAGANGGAATAPDGSEDSGCGCRQAPSRSSPSRAVAGLLALLCLGLFGRRRSR